LFDKVELWVELGEEQNIKATVATVFLKERSNALEVRLGVNHLANAAIGTTGRATEAGTLVLQIAGSHHEVTTLGVKSRNQWTTVWGFDSENDRENRMRTTVLSSSPLYYCLPALCP
jgi:hypothetical protein